MNNADNIINKYISRKYIYLMFFMILILAAIAYGAKEEWRALIEKIFFNPLGPLIIVTLDVFMQHKDQDIINGYSRQISSVGSVVNDSSMKGDDYVFIRSITDSLSGEDLVKKTSERLDQKELDKNTKAAGEVRKEKENINDF